MFSASNGSKSSLRAAQSIVARHVPHARFVVKAFLGHPEVPAEGTGLTQRALGVAISDSSRVSRLKGQVEHSATAQGR